jgi:hypothetical protein
MQTPAATRGSAKRRRPRHRRWSCALQRGAGHTSSPLFSRLAVVEDQAATSLEQISSLLHEAGETHHRVFRIVDGADDDWASWYADWLINLSELPTLLGVKPVRSELTYLLVSLDKEYSASQPDEPWEPYYAQRILGHFSTPGR